MESQNIRRERRRHRRERRRNPFHKKSKSRNVLTENMLLMSNADPCHSNSSPSTHSTPSTGSDNMKRMQRRHIINPVTSDSEDVEQRTSTKQTYEESYIINDSLVVRTSDADPHHSFKPFLSLENDPPSPLHTPPLPSISTTETSYTSIDLTDVNSVSSIEDITSYQDNVLIDINDEVQSVHNERFVSDMRRPSIKKRGKYFIFHLISFS